MKLKLTTFLFVFCLTVSYAQTKYFSSFDDTKIAYTDEGEGKPVLLIHGFINTRKSWEKSVLKKELLANGYRVIIPDLRGNGDSDKPQDDDSYSKDAEVIDLLFLMADLKISKYHAIGYSRGSIVLAKLLIQDRRIKKAVLGGMGDKFTSKYWPEKRAFQEAFNEKENVKEEYKGAVDYAKSIGADMRSLYLQQKYQPTTTKKQLKAIKAKTLVLAGDEDHNNGDPKDLSEAIPKSKLKIIKGDHNNTYKSEGFSQEVLSFL